MHPLPRFNNNYDAKGGVVESENLKMAFNAMLKIKEKKEGDYDKNIYREVRVEELDVDKEESLTGNSYHVVQETHLEDECVIDSQDSETFEMFVN